MIERINIIIYIFALFTFSCNTDKVEKQSSDIQNQKKEAITENKNTTSDNPSSNVKLFKIDGVEKSNANKIAPNLTWVENGKSTSLKDLKGNVVLLNLWATWCQPCIKEMPDLSKISEELKDKDFKMIGLNVFQQEGSKKVEDFLRTNPVSYIILDGNQEVVDALGEADGKGIDAVPTTFIINKEGKIAETIIGSRDKQTFLKIINKYIN